MNTQETIIQMLEKAKSTIDDAVKVCDACYEKGERELGSEAASLVRLNGLLTMSIDSLRRGLNYKAQMVESEKRIDILKNELTEISGDIKSIEGLEKLLDDKAKKH